MLAEDSCRATVASAKAPKRSPAVRTSAQPIIVRNGRGVYANLRAGELGRFTSQQWASGEAQATLRARSPSVCALV